jgi:hypothetical protein
MTTAQIISLIIVTLVFLISLYVLSTSEDEEYKNTANFFVGAAFMFMLAVTSVSTFTVNKLVKENKCPEYERIENVYILKK